MAFRASGVLVIAFAVLLSGVAPAGAADANGRREILLGWSVHDRPIVAVESGDFDASRRILVVGCIHGNEPAGIAVAHQLDEEPPPHELDLWVIPNLNPDGAAAGTRGNAHGVDLNRNFPWRWRRLAGVHDSGPQPLSEPESRLAYALITTLSPRVSIWFHQHLDLVDESGGAVTVERRFARLTRMRFSRLPREPGSVVGWENHLDPSASAFVVELARGSLSPTVAGRLAHAVIALGRERIAADRES